MGSVRVASLRFLIVRRALPGRCIIVAHHCFNYVAIRLSPLLLCLFSISIYLRRRFFSWLVFSTSFVRSFLTYCLYSCALPPFLPPALPRPYLSTAVARHLFLAHSSNLLFPRCLKRAAVIHFDACFLSLSLSLSNHCSQYLLEPYLCT